jgi:hypothetical protein
MIPLIIRTPLSSFLEAYDLAKKTLRDEGHNDTNFTIHSEEGELVDLKTVQQGGHFVIKPGSPIKNNPPQPYAFAQFKNERADPRGNFFPQLTPKYLSSTLVSDMFEQHGAFQGTCNIITGLNTSIRSGSLPHQGIMRARIVDVESISPDSGYVRNNPRPIVARPAQILAGQEDIFNAEIDRRMKEYFSEEGYGIDPYTEVSEGSDGRPQVSYSMSDVDQFYDNHRLSSKYQASTDLFYRFCKHVLEPYLVHSATVDNFTRHISTEILPSLSRLDEEGRNVGLSGTPVGGNSRSARAGNKRRYSGQLKYMMQRLATDAADFYHGKDMSLMVHPVFLIPHMQYVLLPPPHIELETASGRRTRNSLITRAERLFNEGGEPPRYANTGERVLPDYNDREGGGSPVLVPLHHLAAVGPGTAAFSWSFLQEQIQNLNIPGILEALFRPLDIDDTGPIESHRVEDYIEAARRLYTRSRSSVDSLNQNNLNYALGRERTGIIGERQTGEMYQMPYGRNYTRADLNRMNKDQVISMAYNIIGQGPREDPQYKTKAAALTAILEWQDANPIENREASNYVIMANTPILFEIDLPGLHPNPLGWPEELVYSMMEVLAKHRENISGLNGETFRRDEFLSPSINSNFRFDPDAEIELSWYDTQEQRQRRYGLSWNMIQGVLNLREEGNFEQLTKGIGSAARIAYALLTEDDRQNNREGDRRLAREDGFEDLSTLLGFINSQPKGKLGPTAMAEYTDLYTRLTDDSKGPSILERMGFRFRVAANKHFFVNAANEETSALNRLLLCKLITEQNVDTYFQQAMNTGQGMVNLNVNTSSGLSSMFILRETLKQARIKYNYVASSDDTAFIYHLMVWCLDNCLGARRQTSQEKRSIGDLFRGMMNNLSDRNEADVERNVQRAFDNAQLDEHQEAMLVDIMLEALNR